MLREYFRMYANILRRKLVRYLLDDEGLTLEIRETPHGHELQLIDLKRRLPYGQWKVEKHPRRRLYRLTWLPASGCGKCTVEGHPR